MADLGRLFEKLGRQAGLSASEIISLRQKGQALDLLEGAAGAWTKNLPYSFDVEHLNAGSGEFGTLPLEIARLGTNTNQTIATSTNVVLKPADAVSTSGPSFTHGLEVNVTAGSINLGTFDSPSVFLLVGIVGFLANATGQRQINIHDADSGDPGTANVLVHDSDAASIGGVYATFSYVWRNAGVNGDNLRIGVWQSSGGNLDVDYWRFAAIRIH